MKSYLPNISPIAFTVLIFLCLVGCKEEDDFTNNSEEETTSLLPYDAKQHIYGTFRTGSGEWEIVIDPLTGAYSKIPETKKQNTQSLSLPIGTRQLTAFNRNERIYVPSSNQDELKVQNLETFNTETIALKDTQLDETCIPDFCHFGNDENELYLWDNKTIWKVDLESKLVRKIRDRISLASGIYLSNFFYVPSSGKYLLLTNTEASNAATADQLYLFDPSLPDSMALANAVTIPSGFGFVQHPINRNDFYFMNTSQSDKGFRLMKARVSAEDIIITELSNVDLAIDNLALYLQTIHTETNAYIMLESTGTLEEPLAALSSIDLTTGDLIRKVKINETGRMMKLAGE